MLSGAAIVKSGSGTPLGAFRETDLRWVSSEEEQVGAYCPAVTSQQPCVLLGQLFSAPPGKLGSEDVEPLALACGGLPSYPLVFLRKSRRILYRGPLGFEWL